MNTQTAPLILNKSEVPELSYDDLTVEMFIGGDPSGEDGWKPFHVATLDSNGQRYYRVIDFIAGMEGRSDVRALWEDIRVDVIAAEGPCWVIPFGNVDDSEYALAEDLLYIAEFAAARA